MMQCATHHIFINRLDITGLKFLGPQTISPAKHITLVANNGFDCGVTIADYQDIREGDIVEVFTEVEVK